MRRKSTGIFILVFLLVLTVVVFAVFMILHHSTEKKYTNADFNIPGYVSEVDMDGDGIDDQTDFLQNVRAYLDTNPVYKSKYYDGGYPDDEYGVCTDVIAFGMLSAGYNLRDLVDEDIREHPDRYDIDTPDKNIDFRRVTVLKVFFDYHAIVLK